MGSKSRGFTLIEMLIVMAILALLLTIALPRYFGSLDKSREVALQENLRVLRVTIDRFHADKGRFPATLEELVDAKYLRAVPMDPVTESTHTWILVPAREQEASGIVDVKSGAPGSGKDGISYGSL
ncbi:prepilin-type N-terminal cleavage/methylation domain-containing protein [Verminephrobacter aporrectodeae subsp. tuberculatae]|uniref:Prepilin-type N-terminal cleavage/methylation domain-containing protein n=1 Tax=Verminephrobacter aporrectodeae subsp. tuberculatae TaxID=1110392 RepID=A0ABT3KS08_9BURK|nr:type II secretion system GspH family protein [Verminephrobacter aporrectodeae]MCW5219935.1 prepilin-type N-terminal cleavage/methylation domain-containing protein [Verminephrobacter aporrectodeae subsp. tuberculatae]MCW5289223.1 prepilin-type N-terminal cleavage/methylation domain-containing protein [Verminephrobacter aporrectodeae subsp. tuberculatae]MCW5321113.1 prepilin-type N-terminal cleavage/methylation domain-containing protein [Verminephrobacter aporrectodeae subsp. tuberculatae]MCW8